MLAVQAEINTTATALGRPAVDLINAEEEDRIRQLIAARTYPRRWSDDDPDATSLINQTYRDGAVQALLFQEVS